VPRENDGMGASSDSFLLMESNCKDLICVMASRKMADWLLDYLILIVIMIK
jgi:hypothetical protein